MTASPNGGRTGRLHPVQAMPLGASVPLGMPTPPVDGNPGGDTVAALTWGVKRYAWLLLACLVLVGILLPLQQLKKQEAFTAEALVVASELTADTSVLPRYGAAIFDNGQVARVITERYGDAGDLEDVVPRRVSVVTEQDSLVFRVQGHSRDVDTAVQLADTAAFAFVLELNKAGDGIGTFMVQATAVPPVESDEPLRAAPYAISVGLAAGVVVALGVLMLLLVLRRPVVEPLSARRATDLPLLGTVTLPRRPRGEEPTLDEVAGLAPLCRQLLDWSPAEVVLTGPDTVTVERQQLAQALANAFEQVRHVDFVPPGQGAETAGERSEPAASRPILVVDGAGAVDLVAVGPRSVVLLVVPVGVAQSRLRRLAGELRGVPAGVVLVAGRRRRRRQTARPRRSRLRPWLKYHA